MPPEQPVLPPLSQSEVSIHVPFLKRKIIWIPLLIVLASGLYMVTMYFYNTGNSDEFASNTTAVPLPTFEKNADGSTTYVNNQFGFSIRYGSELAATTSLKDVWPTLENGSGVVLSQASTTGIARGTVVVNASNDPLVVAQCLTVPTSAEEAIIDVATTTINGVTFRAYIREGVAMGHISSERDYIAVRSGICYSIVNTLQMYALDRLSDTEAVQERSNIAQVRAQLDSVATTFTFTNPEVTGPLPTCTLTADKNTYKLGDTVRLSWSTTNANIARWKPMSDLEKDMPPPLDTPTRRGSSTTIANIEGSSPVTLYVGGVGGTGSCSVSIGTVHADVNPGVHVDPKLSIDSNGNRVRTQFTGTVERPELLHGELQVIAVETSYTGPTDEVSLLSLFTHKEPFQYYLGYGATALLYDWDANENKRYTKKWDVVFWDIPAATYTVYFFPSKQEAASSTKALASANWTVSTASGMTSYKEPGFAYYFYYPQTWTVKDIPVEDVHRYNGGTVVKELAVTDGTRTITIEEFTSETMHIIDATGPNSINYRFDTGKYLWMGSNTNNIEMPADSGAKTMGNLHMFFGAKAGNANTIVPLSAHNFLIVTSKEPAAYNQNPLVRTIVPLDPAVGLLASSTEQTMWVDAAAEAYR